MQIDGGQAGDCGQDGDDGCDGGWMGVIFCGKFTFFGRDGRVHLKAS